MYDVENRIKKIRLKAGLTQRDVAHAADIAQPYLSRIESGNAPATNETMEKIIEAIDRGMKTKLPRNTLCDVTLHKAFMRISKDFKYCPYCAKELRR